MQMIDSLKGRWSELQAREQRMLRYGGIILALLVMYLLIIDPVFTGRKDAEQSLQAARDAYSLMQSQVSDLKVASATTATPGSGSLLTLIESSAQEEGLRDALERLQPNGNEQIQVSLEGASYVQLMRWLNTLNQQGVRVQRADIQVDDATDLLGVQLLLER